MDKVQKLKLITMKSPLFAEERISSIQAELMFGNPEPIMRSILEKELNSLQIQVKVDYLTNNHKECKCYNCTYSKGTTDNSCESNTTKVFTNNHNK